MCGIRKVRVRYVLTTNVSPMQSAPLRHMACHDYTNKVSYTSTASSPETTAADGATMLFSNFVDEESNDIKIKKAKSRKRSGKGRRGCQKRPKKQPVIRQKRRAQRAGCEDQDYLAHGTGIPR